MDQGVALQPDHVSPTTVALCTSLCLCHLRSGQQVSNSQYRNTSVPLCASVQRDSKSGVQAPDMNYNEHFGEG